MLCPERERLLVDYRDTLHSYSERVRDLVEMVGLGINADMDLLRRKVRDAHERAEKARMSLHRHEADHFCDRLDFFILESTPPEVL